MDDLSESELLGEQPPSPSPTGSLPRPRRARLFFQGAGEEQEETPETSWSPGAAEVAGGSVSAGESSSPAPSAEDGSGRTSSPESSADTTTAPLLKKADLQRTARKGVLIASGMAHRLAARTDLQRQAGLYIADLEDQAHIGDPIASFLSRRGGIAGKELSPDANDLVAGLFGIAGYISKQVALTLEIREVEAQVAGQHVQGVPTGAEAA